jgi:hypothetical protein
MFGLVFMDMELPYLIIIQKVIEIIKNKDRRLINVIDITLLVNSGRITLQVQYLRYSIGRQDIFLF